MRCSAGSLTKKWPASSDIPSQVRRRRRLVGLWNRNPNLRHRTKEQVALPGTSTVTQNCRHMRGQEFFVLTRRERRAYPSAVCKERATQSARKRTAARRVAPLVNRTRSNVRNKRLELGQVEIATRLKRTVKAVAHRRVIKDIPAWHGFCAACGDLWTNKSRFQPIRVRQNRKHQPCRELFRLEQAVRGQASPQAGDSRVKGRPNRGAWRLCCEWHESSRSRASRRSLSLKSQPSLFRFRRLRPNPSQRLRRGMERLIVGTASRSRFPRGC